MREKRRNPNLGPVFTRDLYSTRAWTVMLFSSFPFADRERERETRVCVTFCDGRGIDITRAGSTVRINRLDRGKGFRSMSYAQQQGSSSSSSGSGAVERGETTIHDQQQQQPTSSSYAAGIASIPEPGPSAAPIPLSSSGSKASQSKQAHKTSSMTKRQQAAHRARILAVSIIYLLGKPRWVCWCSQAHLWLLNQLSKQLATRLQYGMFKVEHGWVCSQSLAVTVHAAILLTSSQTTCAVH